MTTKWSSCRSVGNIALLKVSYLVLVLAPFAPAFIEEVRSLGLDTCQIFALYFSSLILALANAIYDIFCPSIIKRFESPNDMFRDMIAIKKLSSSVFPRSDKFVADYGHAEAGWRAANQSRSSLAAVVFSMFCLSLSLFLYLIIARSITLIYALLGTQPPCLCPL